MDTVQNVTVMPTDEEVSAANAYIPSLLKIQQQLYIDYCALGGLITDEEGNFKKMSAEQLAEDIGVPNRRTFYTWQKQIPDFWGLVRTRRKQLSRGARATKVYNGLYLRACKGDPTAVRLWADIFDDYQPPSQKHEVLIGGLADLAILAEKKQIVEGETA